jgi:hypothetical protein
MLKRSSDARMRALCTPVSDRACDRVTGFDRLATPRGKTRIENPVTLPRSHPVRSHRSLPVGETGCCDRVPRTVGRGADLDLLVPVPSSSEGTSDGGVLEARAASTVTRPEKTPRGGAPTIAVVAGGSTGSISTPERSSSTHRAGTTLHEIGTTSAAVRIEASSSSIATLADHSGAGASESTSVDDARALNIELRRRFGCRYLAPESVSTLFSRAMRAAAVGRAPFASLRASPSSEVAQYVPRPAARSCGEPWSATARAPRTIRGARRRTFQEARHG